MPVSTDFITRCLRYCRLRFLSKGGSHNATVLPPVVSVGREEVGTVLTKIKLALRSARLIY